MTNTHQANEQGLNDMVIGVFLADINWLRYNRNILILLMAIAGIIVFILSIIFQSLIYGIIRGLIFLVAGLIVYYRSGSILNYRIQLYRGGKIIIKRGLIRRVILGTPTESVHIVKKGKYWLLGIKKVRVPIDAFPNLDKQLKSIKV